MKITLKKEKLLLTGQNLHENYPQKGKITFDRSKIT